MTHNKRDTQRISILLPTFNGEKYVGEQVRSILEQSHDDFELLISDDGSSDATYDVLQSFAKRDSRIRLFSRSQNFGQNRRLGALLLDAQGDLIAFADQDDVWDKRKLECLHGRLGDIDVGLAFGASHLIDAHGRRLNKTLHEQAGLDLMPEDRLRLLFFPMVSAHAMLVRKHLLWPGSFASAVQFDWAIGLDAHFSGALLYDAAAVTFHRIHGANQSNGDLTRGIKDVSFVPKLRLPRCLLASGNDDRARFYKRLCYLAYSPVIPRDVQIVFQSIIVECENAWFATPVRRHQYRKRCRDRLCSLLLPLASNKRDHEQALNSIVSLCSSLRTRRSFMVAR